MKQSTKEAYAEVDTILELMDVEYSSAIPKKLRDVFREFKDTEYKKEIVADKPLEEQGLNRETITLLAILNYNYWCKDPERKKELMRIYTENGKRKEEEIREKYNPDNIFKTVEKEEVKETLQNENENTSLVEYKEEKWYTKILTWISKIFKKS